MYARLQAWPLIAEAHASLARIEGQAYAENALREISITLFASKKNNWRTLFAPELGPALVVGVVLVVFQQWCGINVISTTRRKFRMRAAQIIAV